MVKIVFLVALGLAVLASDVSAAADSKIKNPRAVSDLESDATKSLVDFYSCAGKADGNYVHPFDCTKFMSCVAQQYAYERLCADCHVNPDNCPTGRLHYHHPDDACLWSYEAGCVVDTPIEVTSEDPVPTEGTSEAPVPTEDPGCDPDDCWVTGYCHDYSWCERDASDHKGKGKRGTTKSDTCDESQNLYFNPNHNSVHGGVCDFWENLDEATKEVYNKDPSCIDPHCEWKPDPEKECSSKYWYFHPEQNDGKDKEMHCPNRPDGEALIWDQDRKSCHPCAVVKDSKGDPCC